MITLPYSSHPRNKYELEVDLANLDLDLEYGLWVFVGANNAKKSVLLKNIQQATKGQYISPSRFEIKSSENIPSDLETAIQQSRNQAGKAFYSANHRDISEYPTSNIYLELINLTDEDLAELQKFHNAHFDELIVTNSKAGARFSPPKITLGGHDASTAGTGSRSILHLLVRLFDSSLKCLCIDEPEIGLEPRKQKFLAEILQLKSKSKKIFLATHSNLFLDKKDIKNNYKTSSDANSIYLKQVATNTDLVATSFNLLGGSPADIFFPNNILLVEGRSDKIFAEKIIALMFPRSSIAVHFAEGITKIDAAIPAIEQMLKSLSYMSIYLSKLCVLLDKDGVNAATVMAWRGYLGDTDYTRVIQLEKNGIEYYYPRDLLKTILSASTDIGDEQIKVFNDQCRASGRKDTGTLGGIEISKVELAEKISEQLTMEDVSSLDCGLIGVIQRLGDLAFSD